MNDIDIVYDRDKKEYMLGIETAYIFRDGKEGECKYLRQLLNLFTNFRIFVEGFCKVYE